MSATKAIRDMDMALRMATNPRIIEDILREFGDNKTNLAAEIYRLRNNKG